MAGVVERVQAEEIAISDALSPTRMADDGVPRWQQPSRLELLADAAGLGTWELRFWLWDEIERRRLTIQLGRRA